MRDIIQGFTGSGTAMGWGQLSRNGHGDTSRDPYATHPRNGPGTEDCDGSGDGNNEQGCSRHDAPMADGEGFGDNSGAG